MCLIQVSVKSYTKLIKNSINHTFLNNTLLKYVNIYMDQADVSALVGIIYIFFFIIILNIFIVVMFYLTFDEAHLQLTYKFIYYVSRLVCFITFIIKFVPIIWDSITDIFVFDVSNCALSSYGG